MRVPTSSLGLKINLALIIFLLVLLGATTGIILNGFQKTQSNATNRSRQGLEALGSDKILYTVRSNAQIGVYQMQWASDAGHIAAKYLTTLPRVGGGVPFDTSTLAKTPDGVIYDPNPNRISDVAMPNFAPLTPAAIQDIQQSAALDAVFQSFLTPYPGRVRDAGFDGVAAYFTSVNQVTRYYPAIGIQAIAKPDTDLSPRLAMLGPDQNPSRKTIWTAPYQDNAGQGLVLSAYTPVYDGNTYRGVFGVDLSMAKLVDVVNGVDVTASNFAFYLDADGKLLASNAYQSINDILAGPDGTALSQTLDAMRRGESNVARISLKGRETFVAYAPLQSIGGSFAIAAPVDELTQQAASITSSIETEGHRTILLTLTGMGFIFLMGLAAATWLNRRVLIRPIEALVAGTEAVAAGDLNTTLRVSGDDEMTTLARSFNSMTAEIRQRSEALEREVNERRQAQDELRALFAAMTDMVVVVDKDGHYVRSAPTSPQLSFAAPNVEDRSLYDVMSKPRADELVACIQDALRQHATQTLEFSLSLPTGQVWLSAAISPMSGDTVIIVAREVTERIKASQALEAEVAERRLAQDELRALFAAMTDYVVVVDKDGRYMRVQDTNTPTLLAPPEDLLGKTMAEVMPPDQAESFLAPIREALAAQETRTIEYRLEMDGRVQWFSTAISPMSQEAVVIVARDITERVAARQELERRVEERTRELEAVLDISKNVASTLELKPLLVLLLEQLKSVADYHRASIFLLEGNELVMLDSRQDTGTSAPISLHIPLDIIEPMWRNVSKGEPYIIDNVRGDSDAALGYRRASGDLLETAFRQIHSWMAVPLALKDRMLGMMTVSHEQESYYTPHHAEIVTAIAAQAAVAIENARLYQQAQSLAAVEERQRLARELHDSVSQALYGIALGARTARTLLDRDPPKAIEPVDYVLSLAEAGLAEMRALIFELRPESLEIEGLVAALDKQIAATAARYSIAVEADLGEEPSIPLSDKEVFYRVGQEALHNMIKHSRATHASVRLVASNGDISIEVRDNGVGFDSGGSFPGHMGLVSMAERAASIGAELEVESAPGGGTTVRMSRHHV